MTPPATHRPDPCHRCGTPPADDTLEHRGADGVWRWACSHCGQVNWPHGN